MASQDWENRITEAIMRDFRNCYNNFQFYLTCYEFDLDTCDYTDLAKENREYSKNRGKNPLEGIKENLSKLCELTNTSYSLDFFLESL